MSNYKIAVLGDKDSVLGFKALGLDVFPAESAEEAKRTLHALAKENYAVVYLTEGYAAHMEAELERYKDALTPAIILIPGKDGSLGIGMANVKRAVERAVGADSIHWAKVSSPKPSLHEPIKTMTPPSRTAWAALSSAFCVW